MTAPTPPEERKPCECGHPLFDACDPDALTIHGLMVQALGEKEIELNALKKSALTFEKRIKDMERVAGGLVHYGNVLLVKLDDLERERASMSALVAAKDEVIDGLINKSIVREPSTGDSSDGASISCEAVWIKRARLALEMPAPSALARLKAEHLREAAKIICHFCRDGSAKMLDGYIHEDEQNGLVASWPCIAAGLLARAAEAEKGGG